MNADYGRTQLKDQVIQNTLTGCTACYNRALAELLVGMPEYMVMHDWWVMLVASAFGHIGHIDDQTVYYRQHAENVVAAKDVRTLQYKIKRLINSAGIKEAINQTYPQAECFLKVYGDRLAGKQRSMLESYCGIPRRTKVGKWFWVFKLGTFKCGFFRNIAYLAFI